ncbi:tumor necrosis factor ligand superfamily member 18 [Esox lucius]|uniref:THD domain-containing protein n=1 Tax=Esox lucius TaxID=8010 RepID=A0A3P8Z5B7_ESOLU|nr:tumor necrosis factor ligand superfamily member 18 [Esox lucius]
MKQCEVSDSCHGTRPQRNQTKLVCGLLFWVCLLTVSQVMSITLLFIGKSDKLRASPTVGPIVTFEPKEVNESGVIHWKTQPIKIPLLDLNNNGSLTILYDGTYFLYLQVTQTSALFSSCDVKLKTTNKGVLLEGRMTNTSLSTGFLGRAVKLTTPDILEVTISPVSKINTGNTATYLGVLMLKNDTDNEG